MPERQTLSAPAARAVAEEAWRLLMCGGVNAALELFASTAPRALADGRVLFKLKRHEVIHILRSASNAPVWLRERRARKKREAASAAAAAPPPPLPPLCVSTLAALYSLEGHPSATEDSLLSMEDDAEFEAELAMRTRKAKAEALRLLREELAPLALEAEPDSYELFRSTLLLLNEVNEGDGAGGGGKEGEKEKEKGGGKEDEEEEEEEEREDSLARDTAAATAAVAALGAGGEEEAALPPPPPPPTTTTRTAAAPAATASPPSPQEPQQQQQQRWRTRSRFAPPSPPAPAPPSAPPSALDDAGSQPAAVAGFLRRTLLASLGVRAPPMLEAVLRYLCLTAVSAHESRLGAAVEFVRQIEEDEARQEEELEHASRGGGGGDKSSSSSIPPSALIVSALGNENGRDAPPLTPLETEEEENAAAVGGGAPSSSSSFPRPGSSAHEASVQALREALRLLSRDEAARVLAAARGDPGRAVLSELMAWGSSGSDDVGCAAEEARRAIGALAREYAAARGLLNFEGESGSGERNDGGGGGGGGGGEEMKKKTWSSSSSSPPQEKSSPSSEAKEAAAMEQVGDDNDTNLMTSPPRKARRRRHGSKENGDDADADEGEQDEGEEDEEREKTQTENNSDPSPFSSIAAGHARVRKLLSWASQGRATEVEQAIEAASPGMLRSRPAAAFDLRAARLRHLAARDDARAALAEARAALSPLADACPELLLPRLKETMAGLLPGGGNANANASEPLLPPSRLDNIRALLFEALKVPQPRLGTLLTQLLQVHEAWFAAQRCRDALEAAVGLPGLRSPRWDPWASLPPASATAAATTVRGAAGNNNNNNNSGNNRTATTAARTTLDWTHSAGWHAIAGVRGQALVLGTGSGSGGVGGGGAGAASRGVAGGELFPVLTRDGRSLYRSSQATPLGRGEDGDDDDDEGGHSDDDDNDDDDDDDDEDSDEEAAAEARALATGAINPPFRPPAATNNNPNDGIAVRFSDDDEEEEDDSDLSGDDEGGRTEEERLMRREVMAAAHEALARGRERDAAAAAPTPSPPDEDVVMVMEFTGMGRHAALELLERHGGSPQAAVQSLYS